MVREWLLVALAATVGASYLYLSTPNIIARDSLYHLRHAALYAQRGLLMREFPWASYSVIKQYQGDIWYGFHLLLIPFTFVPEAIMQVKLAGIFLLVALLLLFYFAVRRCRLARPFVWPFVLLLPFAWRLAQARPNVLSLGLGALLFALAVGGSGWGVALASLALTFVHSAFFWLPAVVVAAVAITKWQTEKSFPWRTLLAALAGTVGGLLLRPNPLGATKILYIQTVELMAVKQQGLPLAFGRELYRIQPQTLFGDYGFFLTLWLGAGVLVLAMMLLRRGALPARGRTLLWSSLALSLLFFAMTVFVSERAVDLWAPFAVFLIGTVFTYYLDWHRLPVEQGKATRRSAPTQSLGTGARLVITVVAVLLFTLSAGRSLLSYRVKLDRGVNPYRIKAAADWLKANTRPGEIVFHANWGSFTALFYWNTQNYYIGGMDPIFQYAYDPALYWKAHHLLKREGAEYTWGSAEQSSADYEDTYTVLVSDFKASYFLVEKGINPESYDYARSDARFELCFDDGGPVAIFRLAGR